MTRPVPAALQAHLDANSQTIVSLLKITARDGTVVAVTEHDAVVPYDDGAGEVNYSPVIGVDLLAMESSSDLKVDNSEATMLLADAGDFTAQKIEAGVFDYASYVVYRVNWEDTAAGHYIPPGGVGFVGRAFVRDDLVGVLELRGLQQWLKQDYGPLYSLTCRARFGSGGGASCLRTGQCGFDAASLWQSHSVAAVDADDVDRSFTANAAPAVNGPNGALEFVPGLVEWLTGDNAGLQAETETVSGADIALRFPTPYPIQASDTFKIRPDCAKRFQEDCIDRFDNYLNFRGEPFIPLADEGPQSTPAYSGTWQAPLPDPAEIP